VLVPVDIVVLQEAPVTEVVPVLVELVLEALQEMLFI
jgi:hypothetical protein